MINKSNNIGAEINDLPAVKSENKRETMDLATAEDQISASVSLLDNSTIEDVEKYEDSVREMGIDVKDELNNQGMFDKYCNGLYARTLFIPKGILMTGALHKNDYIDIFISGDITVKSYYANGDIEEVTRVDKFQYFNGKAGRKRVLYAHEDTMWVTVDPTIKDDVAKARGDIVELRYKDFLNGKKELVK
jgi:hypothetical protein